jgi:hypothetical protein
MDGLGVGGRQLWEAITAAHELDDAQKVQLLEACRAKDRLDRLDTVLSVEIDTDLLRQANVTANLLKQLLAALRLPDPQSGRRPQYRGSRLQQPTVPGGRVSSIDRARARKTS